MPTQLAGVWLTLRLWLMGDLASLAFQTQSCLQVSVIPMADGLGQTLELVKELKVNVSRCCLYGVCFLL